MKVKSFAKINLGLEVIRRRKDNYHEIRTLFQSIGLYDALEFKTVVDGEIRVEGDDDSIPWNKDNLIYKAALLLQKRFDLSQGVEVRVRKNIPPGKGLGGGSSNAAMSLYALNTIWGLRLTRKDLMELGKNIGADVPYFLEGGLCLGLERGDKIVTLEDINPSYCLLALPAFSIATSSVYSRLPLALTSEDKDSKIIKFLTGRNYCYLTNSLEETIFSLYPQLRVIKNLFQNLGSELSLVSGTGAAVFGLFKDKEKAEEGLEKLKQSCPSLLVETLSRKSYWERLKIGV